MRVRLTTTVESEPLGARLLACSLSWEGRVRVGTPAALVGDGSLLEVFTADEAGIRDLLVELLGRHQVLASTR
jgi:hypothetical protein